MGDRRFYQGMQLSAIFFADEDDSCLKVTPTDEIGGVKSIEVIMETGQMAGVPWALVTPHSGSKTKWNLALMAGVELLPEEIPHEQI